MKKEIQCDIISCGNNTNAKRIVFHYWTDVTFREKLLFLFGRKKICVDNDVLNTSDGNILIKNHIKFLNLSA